MSHSACSDRFAPCFSATAANSDFTSDVVRMRDSGVKLVYLLAVDDKSTARFAKAMQAQNYKPEVFAINASGYDPDVLALAGNAVEGMLVTMSLAMFHPFQ